MFKNKVANYIEEKALICPGQKVLVALSGGADSVALLCVLIQLGYQCEAVHCNFHLRGDESIRDEVFVRKLCESRNVSLHVTHFETEKYAQRNGISIEMAARKLRYDWFDEMRDLTASDVVAVAHHLDDSVETYLLNLSRGTGINGLKGIVAKNGYIVRPLLDTTRKEILEYLSMIQQSYVVDSTNLQDIYVRNKIRLDIIPLFEEINPSFCQTVAETSKRLQEVSLVYRAAIQESLQRVKTSEFSVSISRLLKEPSPACLLYEWLSPYGFNSPQIKDVFLSLSGESGKLFLSKNWKLLRDRKELLLRSSTEEKLLCSLSTQLKDVDSLYEIKRSKKVACVDADKLVFPLTMRRWKSGDRFIPYGMKEFKKVRDYLRDRKFSLFEKEEQMVVLSGDDIIWLVNERVDQRYSITEKTNKVLEMMVKEENI